MPKITILYDSTNFSIIKDNITGYVWLYSDRKPIAYFDVIGRKFRRYDKTDRESSHIGAFKKKLKDL